MTVRQALKVPGRYGFHSTRSGHAARGVKLVMSDAHEGMKATLANLLKSSWQRCCFDFMRNALAHAARPDGASSPPSKPFAPGAMPRLPRRSGARSAISSATSCRSLRLFEAAETDVLAYTTSRRSTGPSCTPRMRWTSDFFHDRDDDCRNRVRPFFCSAAPRAILPSRPSISQPPRAGAVKAGRVCGHRKAWP
jgi:putative transposase